MIPFLIIATVVLIIFLLIKKKDSHVTTPLNRNGKVGIDTDSNKDVADVSDFNTITHVKLFHRKTFIKGKLISKYYGELDYIKNSQYLVKEKYYDITLYEAEVQQSQYRKNNEGPFHEFNITEMFPGIIYPSPLPCKISYENIEGDFQIDLYDLKLANIDFNKHRALHQEEDDYIFGTVEADITGYILEEFTEEYQEQIKVEPFVKTLIAESSGIDKQPTVFKTKEKTGRSKIEGDYRFEEFWFSDRKMTYWGIPTFIGEKEPIFLNLLGQLIGIGLLVLFLIAIGPQGIIVLLIISAIALFIAFFSQILIWLFRIVGFLMILFAVLGIITAVKNNARSSTRPFAKDEPREIIKIEPDKTNINDSLIVHHRVWQDYNGIQYEGDIWVKSVDFKASGYFKNHLGTQGYSLPAYDNVLRMLKNQDSSKLNGVYLLLDSIRTSNSQTVNQFAETIVSFIQDIPYAIVLDDACDPSLYSELFTKRYLLSHQGECDGYQKFGINTPVEFMGTLKGDCDTRTLLLYTMLSHYGYDVALLSSELYSHSILAINLPFSGKSITANGKQYIVWETTSPGIKPGLLPEEVSNMDNWRISLISKS